MTKEMIRSFINENVTFISNMVDLKKLKKLIKMPVRMSIWKL